MSLPQFIYQSNRSAVILPVFFYKGKQILAHCSTTESCAYLYSTRFRLWIDRIGFNQRTNWNWSNASIERFVFPIRTTFELTLLCFDIDVCNAGMVYHIKRIACLSSSLLSHKFHGAVDGSDIFLIVDTWWLNTLPLFHYLKKDLWTTDTTKFNTSSIFVKQVFSFTYWIKLSQWTSHILSKP